ncbi:MAG: Sua5/YciO/YrdC/YwlC family protein [Actinomycetota bacterium]|nr:Sua5/YciO/YrdC/YwlC family protein [Actinomycetota bacterium]
MSWIIVVQPTKVIYAYFIVNPKLVDPASMSFDSLVELLSTELLADKVVAMATDTVFGLVGSAASCEALDAIALIKGRDPSVSMPVVISKLADLDSLVPSAVLEDPVISHLFDRLWPGPLTVILPLLPGSICGRFFPSDTVGVRLPADLRLREVAKKVGPMVATSANEHKKATLRSGREVLNELGRTSQGNALSLVLDESSRSESASTIVEVVGKNFRVLREGAISTDTIAKAFRIGGRG